jgi:hypothetical protein
MARLIVEKIPFLEMYTKTKFRILSGCYDNARYFRKCLGIYVIA